MAENLVSGFTTVTTVLAQAVTAITGNDVTLAFLCFGLFGCGLRAFKQAKRAAK